MQSASCCCAPLPRSHRTMCVASQAPSTCASSTFSQTVKTQLIMAALNQSGMLLLIYQTSGAWVFLSYIPTGSAPVARPPFVGRKKSEEQQLSIHTSASANMSDVTFLTSNGASCVCSSRHLRADAAGEARKQSHKLSDHAPHGNTARISKRC